MRRQDNIRAEFPLARWSTTPVIFGLVVGILVGPWGLRLLDPRMVEDSTLIESVSEMALLVSLFCVGLRLRVVFEWRPWRIPLRLAALALPVSAILAAGAAYILFDISFAQALLLGAVLAPTDAVLASDIHVPMENEQESVPFTVAAEGAITSAIAAPLVLLVIGGLGLGEGGAGLFGSLTLAAVWSIAGGIVTGWLIGMGMSRWIALLDADRQGDFLEEMSVFATAALAYTCALGIRAEGLAAVFAAGLSLSHGGRLRRTLRKQSIGSRAIRVAGRVERCAAIMVMVLLGALAAGVEFRFRIVLFAFALLALLRPLSVRLGLIGTSLPSAQRRPLEWFGARGSAALYCLALALDRGVTAPFARELAAITIVVIVVSVVFSAASALSLRRASTDAVDL